MGQVVLAIGVSHVNPVPYGYDEAEVRKKPVMQAVDKVARRLAAVRPDVIVIVSSEHVRSFFLDNLPAFCLGTAPHFDSWQERGLPLYRVPGHQPMAMYLLEQAMEQGFDFSRSDDLKLDHGCLIPLHYLTPNMDIPVIPIIQNCFIPPYPSFRRAVDVGRFLRRAIDAWPGPERVAVIGAGGLSHWLAVPGMGRINEQFDRAFLEDLRRGDIARLAEYTSDWVEEHSGNGGHELRNWVAARAAGEDLICTLTAYEPAPELVVGYGVALFDGAEGQQS